MQLVALDWGTSSLRGALIAADGRVLEERSFARGILTVGIPKTIEPVEPHPSAQDVSAADEELERLRPTARNIHVI